MRTAIALLAALACTGAVHAAAPEAPGLAPLSDAEMQDVSGQQGVLFDITLRNNVSATNTPIGCTVAIGTPNPCRVGLEFAARAGVTLMLKEFYGTLEVNDLRLDAGFMPATNTIYYNPARFRDAAGTDLIAGANPASDAAILFTYPGADAQGTYNDLLSFMNIGRTWLEFDTTVAPITPGYNRDTSLDSVLGVRLADSSALNAAARMRFLGTGYVYGF